MALSLLDGQYFHNLIKGFGLEIPKALVTIPSHGGIVNLPAVIITLILAWMLSRGTRESKRINNIMVLIKIGMILLFITVGIFYVKPMNWIPIAPYGLSGVLRVEQLFYSLSQVLIY